MSISIKCYSKEPFTPPNTKEEIKANLSHPLLTEKTKINLYEFPTLSSKTLEIFRELGYGGHSIVDAINSCPQNVSKYNIQKNKEKTDPSLLYKIAYVAIGVFVLAPLTGLALSALAVEIPVLAIMALAGAVFGFRAATSWPKAVLNKTKAKYAARADFIHAYHFSKGSDRLSNALDKNIAKSVESPKEKMKLIEKFDLRYRSLWQQVVDHINPAKFSTKELQTARAELNKVNAFYGRFDPVESEKKFSNAEITALFEKVGAPVPRKFVNFDLNKRTTEVLMRKELLISEEKESERMKWYGVFILATNVTLVALGVLIAPAQIAVGWAIGAFVMLLGFVPLREKKILAECQEVLKKDRQEVADFLAKNYASIKEKLIDEALVHSTTDRERRLIRQALQHLKTLRKQAAFDSERDPRMVMIHIRHPKKVA